MPSRASLRPLVFVLAIANAAAAQDVKRPAIPQDLFVHPTGPYAVGMREELWTDAKRGEPFTRDTSDRRRLIVRIWYPAGAMADAERAPYLSALAEFGDSSQYRRATHVRTNALLNAPLAKQDARWPVLVYQPGGGTARFVGTFVAEQLASNGYVVVAADHPGFSETVAFPDGSSYRPDTLRNPAPTGKLRDDVFASWGYLGHDVFPTWVADASFVLDRIEELDRTSGQPFQQHLDLARIGMYGWSFGGATSLQMSRNDPRVKAAIDQDGQLFGDVKDTGTHRPVMLMHHGGQDRPPNADAAPLWKELIALTQSWDSSFIAHSTNDWYDVTIANTQHGHFSDLMLVYPIGKGELDPRRAHEIVTAYTLAFFDKYLRGRDSELLRGPSAAYPEVTFRKKD